MNRSPRLWLGTAIATKKVLDLQAAGRLSRIFQRKMCELWCIVVLPGGSPFATVHLDGRFDSEEDDLQHDVHEQRI